LKLFYATPKYNIQIEARAGDRGELY